MIPVSTLYDEYIERRKFTEQKKKKPSSVYSSSPLKRVGTIKKTIMSFENTHSSVHKNI